MTDWSEVVRRYGPMVWQTAWRLLHHDADAADCFQETFASALKLSRRQEVIHWPGLLKRLATARALERLRQRIREADRTGGVGDWGAVRGQGHSPDEEAAGHELAARLRAALPRLPANQAEAFCLAVFESLNHTQIAEQMRTSAGNVGVLIHRARATLREFLEPQATPTAAEV